MHPSDYTTVQAATAVGVGLTLFLVSIAAALWRAHGCVLWNRLILCVLTLGGLRVAAAASVQAVLIVAAAALTVIVGFEQLKTRRAVGGDRLQVVS